MTGVKFSDRSSVTAAEELLRQGVEVLSCWLHTGLETSLSSVFTQDANAGVVTGGLTAAGLADDKLPMSTMTVWFPIFVANTFTLDEDDDLITCVWRSTEDGFVTTVDSVVFCGRRTETWLLERDICAGFETLLNAVVPTPSHTLTVVTHRGRPADDEHLLTTAEADVRTLLTAFITVLFVPCPTVTSFIRRELPETTLLLVSMTKYTGELEDIGSLAVTRGAGLCVLTPLLTDVVFRLDITAGEMLGKTVMCGKLLAGDFTTDKGTNGRGLITALFNTELTWVWSLCLSDRRYTWWSCGTDAAVWLLHEDANVLGTDDDRVTVVNVTAEAVIEWDELVVTRVGWTLLQAPLDLTDSTVILQTLSSVNNEFNGDATVALWDGDKAQQTGDGSDFTVNDDDNGDWIFRSRHVLLNESRHLMSSCRLDDMALLTALLPLTDSSLKHSGDSDDDMLTQAAAAGESASLQFISVRSLSVTIAQSDDDGDTVSAATARLSAIDTVSLCIGDMWHAGSAVGLRGSCFTFSPSSTSFSQPANICVCSAVDVDSRGSSFTGQTLASTGQHVAPPTVCSTCKLSHSDFTALNGFPSCNEAGKPNELRQSDSGILPTMLSTSTSTTYNITQQNKHQITHLSELIKAAHQATSFTVSEVTLAHQTVSVIIITRPTTSQLSASCHLQHSKPSTSVCNKIRSQWMHALTEGRQRLRSTSSSYLMVPWTQTSLGQWTFAVFKPSMWNKLPVPLWLMNTTLQTFWHKLKTHLFQQ